MSWSILLKWYVPHLCEVRQVWPNKGLPVFRGDVWVHLLVEVTSPTRCAKRVLTVQLPFCWTSLPLVWYFWILNRTNSTVLMKINIIWSIHPKDLHSISTRGIILSLLSKHQVVFLEVWRKREVVQLNKTDQSPLIPLVLSSSVTVNDPDFVRLFNGKFEKDLLTVPRPRVGLHDPSLYV